MPPLNIPDHKLPKSDHIFDKFRLKESITPIYKKKIPKQLKPKNYKKNTHNTRLGYGAISGMTHAVAQTQAFEIWTVYTEMYFESIL